MNTIRKIVIKSHIALFIFLCLGILIFSTGKDNEVMVYILTYCAGSVIMWLAIYLTAIRLVESFWKKKR